MDHSLSVTMVTQLLRSDDITVTLQWSREPGAVYHVNVIPEKSHTKLTSMRHDVFAINLTISYNIQCNVSIVSSLCGVTTTRVLKYGKYMYRNLLIKTISCCDLLPTFYRSIIIERERESNTPTTLISIVRCYNPYGGHDLCSGIHKCEVSQFT
jgi:hypothetical protein